MEFLASVARTTPLLLDGLATTFAICLMGTALAFLTAAPLIMARRSRWRAIQSAAKGWVALIRGLPIVILVFLMYFALPALLGVGRVSAWWVGVIALGFNGGAFISEVLRAAIERVPQGQWDACASLALPRRIIWIRVVLPQALRVALPALVGELTFLVKASPVLSLISVTDLTRRAQQVSMQTFDSLTPMVSAALLYFVLLYSLSLFAAMLERRVAIEQRQ